MTLPNARECVLGRALDRRTGQHAHEMIAIFEEDGGTWEQVRDAVHATAATLSACGSRADDVYTVFNLTSSPA
jgi:hypothetical protein